MTNAWMTHRCRNSCCWCAAEEAEQVRWQFLRAAFAGGQNHERLCSRDLHGTDVLKEALHSECQLRLASEQH